MCISIIYTATFTFVLSVFLPPWQNYVTCALGIHFVGFVMMCSGAVDSLCSIVFGRLSRYTGRPALLSLGIMTYIASLPIVVFMIVLFQDLSPWVSFPGVTHSINVCHYPCLMVMIFIWSKTDNEVQWLSIGLASCQQCYNCNLFVLWHDFQFTFSPPLFNALCAVWPDSYICNWSKANVLHAASLQIESKGRYPKTILKRAV